MGTYVDSLQKGFSWFFLRKIHELLHFSLSLSPSIILSPASASSFFSSSFFLRWRFKEPIQWVTSFAHFISVNGDGVTLASLLFNAVHVPFCKLTGVSNTLSHKPDTLYTLYVINMLTVTLLAKTVKTMIFCRIHSRRWSSETPTITTTTTATNNKTMGTKKILATERRASNWC